MSGGAHFCAAVAEELWVGGTLVEKRLSCGEAVEQEGAIVARDRRDSSLIARCHEAIDAMRPLIDPRFRVRLLAEATPHELTTLILASSGEYAIASDPAHLAADLLLLAAAAAPEVRRTAHDITTLPFVWCNGSAAVLLHEAVAHPVEHGRATTLPPWLRVDVPIEERRASFRDVPLQRMTAVNVRQVHAPFACGDARVEVMLVDGGSWDPLTDIVSVRVSFAELVAKDDRTPVEPFTITAPREEILASLRGAEGDPERYPGVICSREGQELFVSSRAPRIVMEHA